MGGISKIIPIQTWGMFRIGEKQKKKKKGQRKAPGLYPEDTVSYGFITFPCYICSKPTWLDVDA